MRRARVIAIALTITTACGDARAPEAPSPATHTAREPSPSPPASPELEGPPSAPPSSASTGAATEPVPDTRDLAALADALDEGADATRPSLEAARVETPAEGPRCVVEPETGVIVWPTAGAVATTFAGPTLVVALHVGTATAEELVVLSVEAGRARPIVRSPLSTAGSVIALRPPGIADLGAGRVGVASVDRAGRVIYVESTATPGRGSTRRELAVDGDPRFSPAVAPFGTKRAIVYVRRGSPSKASLVVLDAALRPLGPARDVTPESSGAASPYFVRTEAGAVLVLVDPREGFSPIHRIPLDANATPSHGIVLKPVTGLLDPARVVAAATREGMHIAYVAHGATQATAIGYVRGEPGAPDPVSLVRPTGFGALWVEAASLPASGLVVFAATAPLGREPTALRGVHVRVATREGLGPATTFTHADGLAFPALAVAEDQSVALTASSMSEVSTVRLRCAP